MPLKVRDVHRALLAKGFRESDKKNSDHNYYILFYNGKRTHIYTKISHGEKELHDQLCAAMARQIRLNKRQLHDLVECPLTYELYIKFLMETAHLKAETGREPMAE